MIGDCDSSVNFQTIIYFIFTLREQLYFHIITDDPNHAIVVDIMIDQ